MRVVPLTASIGAELVGVNLADAAHDDGLFNEIRAQLLKHKVLFLRDQDISRADHVAFARRFGELEDHPVAGSDPEHPGPGADLQEPRPAASTATRTPGTPTPPGARAPPMGCVLRCVECPPVGGDTIWANMVLAYERAAASTSRARSPTCARATASRRASAPPCRSRSAWRSRRSIPDAEHPVVRSIRKPARRCCSSTPSPRTSRNFHTPERVRYGQDYNPGAADLLRYLISQAYIPEYQVRWRWKPNSVAIWDNRSTQHYAVMDYAAVPSQDGARRHHRRQAVSGEPPGESKPPARKPRSPDLIDQETDMNFIDGFAVPGEPCKSW